MKVKPQQKIDLVATLASLDDGDWCEINKVECNVATVRSSTSRYSAEKGIKFSITETGSTLVIERK